eukprot:223015-Hanusia_phi.AAC.1
MNSSVVSFFRSCCVLSPLPLLSFPPLLPPLPSASPLCFPPLLPPSASPLSFLPSPHLLHETAQLASVGPVRRAAPLLAPACQLVQQQFFVLDKEIVELVGVGVDVLEHKVWLLPPHLLEHLGTLGVLPDLCRRLGAEKNRRREGRRGGEERRGEERRGEERGKKREEEGREGRRVEEEMVKEQGAVGGGESKR